ncbi:hypothetical protein [Natronorubrum sp. FCH18a]|uniref:hypothetical protein n=1 Tax=Natronorubrum sp. FCH18a TaxID=3447018 RepID=UPI003F50E250
MEPREFARHVRRHIVALDVEIGQIEDDGGFPGLFDSLGELMSDGQREVALTLDDDVAAILGGQPAPAADVIGERLLAPEFDMIRRLPGFVERQVFACT